MCASLAPVTKRVPPSNNCPLLIHIHTVLYPVHLHPSTFRKHHGCSSICTPRFDIALSVSLSASSFFFGPACRVDRTPAAAYYSSFFFSIFFDIYTSCTYLHSSLTYSRITITVKLHQGGIKKGRIYHFCSLELSTNHTPVPRLFRRSSFLHSTHACPVLVTPVPVPVRVPHRQFTLNPFTLTLTPSNPFSSPTTPPWLFLPALVLFRTTVVSPKLSPAPGPALNPIRLSTLPTLICIYHPPSTHSPLPPLALSIKRSKQFYCCPPPFAHRSLTPKRPGHPDCEPSPTFDSRLILLLLARPFQKKKKTLTHLVSWEKYPTLTSSPLLSRLDDNITIKEKEKS